MPGWLSFFKRAVSARYMNLIRGWCTQYCKQLNNANPFIRNTYKETTFRKVANVFQEASSLLTCSLQIKQIKEKRAFKKIVLKSCRTPCSWGSTTAMLTGERRIGLRWIIYDEKAVHVFHLMDTSWIITCLEKLVVMLCFCVVLLLCRKNRK